MIRVTCLILASLVVAPPAFANDQNAALLDSYVATKRFRQQQAIERICTECVRQAPQVVERVTEYVAPIQERVIERQKIIVQQQQAYAPAQRVIVQQDVYATEQLRGRGAGRIRSRSVQRSVQSSGRGGLLFRRR